jgi:hypothetical protein
VFLGTLAKKIPPTRSAPPPRRVLLHFLAIAALVVNACAPTGNPDATTSGHGYSSPGLKHKVVVPQGAAAPTPSDLIADYGSFRLVEVDSASLAAIDASGLQVADENNLLYLNSRRVDTTVPSTPRAARLTANGKALHIVQFRGPLRQEWVSALDATGVKRVSYVPSNAYLVYGLPSAMTDVQALGARMGAIQKQDAYTEDDKIQPSVNSSFTGQYSIQMVVDPVANIGTLQLLDQLKSGELGRQDALGYVNIVVSFGSNPDASREAVRRVALQGDVVSIHAYSPPRLTDERQDMIVSGNLEGLVPRGPGYLDWLATRGFTQAQFSASGFGVDLSDSGIDNGTVLPNHFGLYLLGNVLGPSRIAYNRVEGRGSESILRGCDGHGNINAHIIGGYNDFVGFPHADSLGFRHGLGVAPWVKIGSSVVFDNYGFFTDPVLEDLQARAYRDGMRLSSNSWGASTSAYDSFAQRYDALVRDAQPPRSAVPVPGNQEMVIVFAAGNDGPYFGSIGSPGNAKNILSAGASENVRPFGGPDRCAVGDASANSALDVADFSSRGPALDGRIKPDLLAPGTHVGGGVFQANGQRAQPPSAPNGQADLCFSGSEVCGGVSSLFYPSGQQWYTASSGTSHSTPAIAGGAGLLRQYFINAARPPPSPAMTKAFLMNSARYMTGQGANDNLYSNHQGMGLLDLGVAFDGVPRLLRDELPADLLTGTGQTRTFSGAVMNPALPFRVTLAWTDAPGPTFASAWANDLDLTVSVGGNTYKGNVFNGQYSVTAGAFDRKNNVESVFLPPGISGDFTVTVTAANITADGVPENEFPLDQDFALVVYNACDEPVPAAPTGVAAAANGPHRIDVTWTPNGAREYRVLRSRTAGGPYSEVARVAAPPFADTDVSGMVAYYYVVRAANCAASPNSTEASATGLGSCTLQPTFAGLGSVNNPRLGICTNQLQWSAGQPNCGGNVRYSVYRSTSPSFVPSADNRIASGLNQTSYTDPFRLINGQRYYYIVRAVDMIEPPVEDTNLVRLSSVPTGMTTPGVRYFDDFDGNRPANASDYWKEVVDGTTQPTTQIVDGCRWNSATHAFKFGAPGCGGLYPNGASTRLTLGGSGANPSIHGMAIPPNAINVLLKFRHWYEFEPRFDGAYLEYSLSNYDRGYQRIPDTVTAGMPYIVDGRYDDLVYGIRSWTGYLRPDNGSLAPVVVNLDALAGSTAWLAWNFKTDAYVAYEGYYLDDVELTYDLLGECATGGGSAVRYQISGLGSSVSAGAPTSFSVTAVDELGYPSTGYTGTATFVSSDPRATLPTNGTFLNGTASNLTVTFRQAGAQSITAIDSSSSDIHGSASTAVQVGLARRLTFDTSPQPSVAGSPIGPIRVAIEDDSGNRTGGSQQVTIALSPSSANATLSGTTTVAASSGVATFSDLVVDKASQGYALVATSTGLTTATSASFDVAPGPTARYAFARLPQTVDSGAAITFDLHAVDAHENTTAYSGAASISSTDAAANLPSTVQFAAGTANAIRVVFKTIGSQQLTVTDSADSSITATVVVAVVSPAKTGCSSTGSSFPGMLAPLALLLWRLGRRGNRGRTFVRSTASTSHLKWVALAIPLFFACGGSPHDDGNNNDSGTSDDAGSGGNPDSGALDGGFDAGYDAGFDAGEPDAGMPDAGVPDAGQPDAGVSPCDVRLGFTANDDSDLERFRGCRTVEGNLTIENNVSQLSALTSLERIQGDLSIIETNNLDHLTGLDRLQYVSGNLTLFVDRALARIDGFSALEEVGGSVSITVNSALRTIDGFPRLVHIGGGLNLGESNWADTIDGFPLLESVGGDLKIEYTTVTEIRGFGSLRSVGSLSIRSDTSLRRISAFNTLRVIYGKLYVDYLLSLMTFPDFASLESAEEIHITFTGLTTIRGFNALTHVNRVDLSLGGNILTSIEGFGSLRAIGDYLLITDNHQLTSVTAFSQVTEIGGAVNFLYDESLRSLSGLRNLRNVSGSLFQLYSVRIPDMNDFQSLETVLGNFNVSSTPIQSVSGLSRLTYVGGDFWLLADNLQDIDGPAALTEVRGSVEIRDNPAVHITGLTNLTRIGGHIYLQDNFNTREIRFPRLQEVGSNVWIAGHFVLERVDMSVLTRIGGDLELVSNGPLSGGPIDIVPFEHITEVPGNFYVSTTALENLRAFSNIQSVGKRVWIDTDRSLLTLEGLENLTTIGTELSITYNNLLTSVDPLRQLQMLGTRLTITDNAQLPQCNAESLLALLRSRGFDGPATIARNHACE